MLRVLLWVLALALGVAGKNVDLLILHNNDLHARFEETSPSSGYCAESAKDCVGGFARIAHVVRQARANASTGEGPKVLFLNAGDTYTGTTWFSVHKWKIAADFLNVLKPDVMCFGNHEFDDGTEGILPFLEAVTFPVVGANIDFSGDPLLYQRNISKSVVLTVEGRKIGVIGYLTPDTTILANPGKVTFTDEVTALQKECQVMTQQGVNIVIALGHSGFKTDQDIALKVDCVDLVIGGHTNTFLWNGAQPDLETPEGPYPFNVKQPTGKVVPVVQAYAFSKYLGQLYVTFDDAGNLIKSHGQPLLLDGKIPQAEDVLNLLETYRPGVTALFDKFLGTSRVYLDGRASTCRHGECNFGNFISDCFVAYRMSVYPGSAWTDTPIGVVQGGGIRNSLDKGVITRGHLMQCMPFENQLISANLTGEDLLKTLDLGVRSNGETSYGEFLQVSGLRVVYDLKKPPGSRVFSASARCSECDVPKFEPIVGTKIYRLITNSFLMNGGDGQHILHTKAFGKHVEDLVDVDAVQWCIENQSPIHNGLEGRISFINSAATTPKVLFVLVFVEIIALLI